uniref:Uncharacterized protein n=1 Tax=Lutzomyia longipalpis TaxID=7200 RepID=A0A1B0CNM2_LUTLO
MKQTMAAFSSMQKQFLNSFRTLQEPRNSPPIVELPTRHQEENSYDDSEDTTEEIRDPRRKYPRTTKDPQVTQVNNVKDVIDKVSRRKKTRPTTTTAVVQSVPQPVQQAVVQPVQQAVVQPVQQAMVQPVQTIQPIQAIQPIQTIQQAPVSTIQGLKLNNNLSWRNLLDRTLSISTAQQTFETIKSDMISALWTGLLVAAVKLAPLILICIKLVFKAILPLVGMSLLNRSTQDVQVQSAVVQPAFAPVVQPAFQPVVQPVLQPAFQRVHQFMPLMTSDTTTTTFQQDVDVDDDTMLDNEFESIKRHFYR